MSKIIKMKNIIYITAILFCGISISAQQEIILTKYTFNSMFFNPAYAGSHGWDEGSINLHYRNQWMGIDGAPTTIMANGELSVFENRVGLGFSLAQESIGIENRFEVSSNFAYRVEMGRGQLAGGIRVGGSFYGSDFGKLNNVETGDQVHLDDVNYKVFTTGMGVYYSEKNFYIGASIPAIVAIGDKPGIGYRERHYYAHSGMMFDNDFSDLKFEPSVLIKYQKAAPLQVTLGVNTWFTKEFAIGVHWRSSDAIALSTELLFDKKYRLGLAYDFTLSELNEQSNGTLELMLGYDFSTSPDVVRIRSIRHGGRF